MKKIFFFLLPFSVLYALCSSVSYAVGFQDYLIPPAGECHPMSSGENFCYQQNAPGEIRLYKNNNYEQFVIKSDGIYRREDTSWATPDWQPVTCTNGAVAAYTYAPCQNYSNGQVISNDGALWLPSTGVEGQQFTSGSFRVQAITRDSAISGQRIACTPSNVSGNFSQCQQQRLLFKKLYQPGQLTYCTGATNTAEVSVIEIINGPGTGDIYYFEKGKGMTGFEASGFQSGIVTPGATGGTCSVDPITSLGPTPTLDPSAPRRAPVSGNFIPPSVSNSSHPNCTSATDQNVGDPNCYTWNRDAVCSTQATIQQSYESPKETTTDGQGNTSSEYVPMTVTEIQGTVDLNEPYTNMGTEDFTLLTAYHPAIKIREKIMHPELYKQRQTSYTKLGFNPSQRILTEAEKKYYKWKLYEQAALSLDDSDPLNHPHTSVTNQVVAWNCEATIYHCLDLTDDRGGMQAAPNGCTPMTLAEVLLDIEDFPDVAYELVKTPDGLRAKATSVPGNIKAILDKYFHQGGYQRDNGRPFKRTIQRCYRLVYQNTEVTVPTGPGVNEITVYNKNADGSTTTKVSYRAIPLLASMQDPNAAPRFFDNMKPVSQPEKYPGSICSNNGGAPTVHQPTPLSFLAYLKNLAERIIGQVTLTKTVQVDSKFDGNISKNLNKNEQFYADFTPQKDQSKLGKYSKSSAGGAGNLPLPHPGQSAQKFTFYKKQLTPACWRTGDCPQSL